MKIIFYDHLERGAYVDVLSTYEFPTDLGQLLTFANILHEFNKKIDIRPVNQTLKHCNTGPHHADKLCAVETVNSRWSNVQG